MRKGSAIRKKNPVPLSRKARVTRAVNLYEQFRGEKPEFIDTVEVADYDTFMVIGYLDFMGYHTRRDGEEERYIHHFNSKSRPLLCSSHDGKQLAIVGGRYKFGDRGIIG